MTDAAAEGANTSFLKRSTRIQVTLVWDDSGNQDGARPSDVTVGLYPQGESGQVSPQITLKRQDDENVWSGSFYAPIQDESGNPVPYVSIPVSGMRIPPSGPGLRKKAIR